MDMEQARLAIIAFGQRMSTERLSPGTSGNLSVYDPTTGHMAISPSGINYFEISPEDIVILDLNGTVLHGHRKPSSEWALHAAFYKHKPQARGVVHTHSLYATTFSIVGKPIEAVHYVIGDAGVDTIPCAPYVTFGTQELADVTLETCGDSNAVLLGNHGVLACGSSLQSAYSLACNVEYLAQLQYQALSIGTPNILTPQQMETVLEQFTTYGQQPK